MTVLAQLVLLHIVRYVGFAIQSLLKAKLQRILVFDLKYNHFGKTWDLQNSVSILN